MAFLSRNTPPHIVTLVLATGVAALSLNIFLPSLPGMARHFGVDYGLMQLAVSAYLAASAVAQFVVGPISDRYGRRPVLLWVVAIFTLASVAALFAPNAEAFLAARFVQAVVATAFVLARAAVRDMVPGPGAASMIGYVTMGMSIVPMIGPAIGGFLDGLFGWHANFTLLLLVGLAVTALVWADLGETSAPKDTRFAEQIRQYPALLASRRFWGYCMAAAFSSGCFFAYLGGAPYVGTEVFKLSSQEIGLLFALTAIGYLIGNFLAGRFSVRVGMNRMVLWGTLTTTVGLSVLALFTVAGLSGPVVFFALTVPMGIGNGLCLPNANAGILSVRPDLAGTASGLGGAIMIGGGAGLAALAGHLLGPGSSELPLIMLMLASSVGSVIAILMVIARARKLGLSGS